MANRDLDTLLVDQFDSKYIKATLRHFRASVADYRLGDWEDAIAKMGKVVEAALKALCKHAAVPFGSGKDFKVDGAINGLAALPKGGIHESVRLTIPRACRFIYDIASNRGGRHDPDEVDPNRMDATAVIGSASWILAEMVRYSQKGSIHTNEAEEAVAALTERHSLLIEKIDDRVYFHIDGKSARQVAVLTLWQQDPRRMGKEDIIASVVRNGFTRKDALTAYSRIARVVDVDGAGRVRLLNPGLREAETIVR